MAMANDTHIYLVDDDAAVLESLRSLFEIEGLMVQSFHSAGEFLAGYSTQRPGCLVLDVRMPGMSGLELQEHLCAQGAAISIVMITANGDLAMAVQAVKRGALHFLEKPFRPEDLISAVREGVEFCQRRFARQRLANDFRERLSGLTADEFAIFKGTVSGFTNTELAVQLGLSLRTVQFRRSDMMRKLGVSTKQELMELVFRAGWSPQQEVPSTV